MFKQWVAALVVVLSLVSAGLVSADESPKILVLPFDIYSDKDLAYLETQIPAIIAGQLEKDGGTIVDTSSPQARRLPSGVIAKEEGAKAAAGAAAKGAAG